jgi:hypothetical protein
MNDKTVVVTLNTDEVKTYNNVEMVDLRDHTIFVINYRDEKGKKCIAIHNRPIDITPEMKYAKSLTINFTE